MESYYGTFDDPSFHDKKRYAWNNNYPMLRPEQMVCPNCHHEIAEAKLQKCESCGTERLAYNTSGDIIELSSVEHFDRSHHIGGGGMSLHCCSLIIALTIFFARRKGQPFRPVDVWTIILILFAPYLYIIYVLFTMLSGLQCTFVSASNK